MSVVEPEVNPCIYVVHSDGTGLKRLTDDPGWEGSPSWSPDGNRIVCVSQIGAHPWYDAGTVRVMNADGSQKEKLTKGAARGSSPTWSPDGKRIAIHDNDEDRIVVVPAHGGGTPVALLDPVSDFATDDITAMPAWTPDGKALAGASNGGDESPHGSRLYIVNGDGSGRSAVRGVDDAMGPAWRPR
jgi:TolB protein